LCHVDCSSIRTQYYFTIHPSSVKSIQTAIRSFSNIPFSSPIWTTFFLTNRYFHSNNNQNQPLGFIR
jgi:hypothetical protein